MTIRFLLAAAMVVLPLWHVPSAAQDYRRQERYSIREPAPGRGMSLRRELLVGPLPLDKRYDELTDEQKRLFKSQYEPMKDGDEPPFPLNGLGPIHEKIAQAQRLLDAKGTLDMAVEIDASGKAASVAVYKSPSAELTQVAAAALLFEKYKPAVCDGRPCSMAFPLRIEIKGR